MTADHRRKAFEVTAGKTATLLSACQADQANYRKSTDQLPRLIQVLDRDVDLIVRAKSV